MSQKTPNRLIHEKSPYLLQHAHNPVRWFPWGDEAFREAEELDKPVFLSIGYSTCHWCHVMEEESFEDEEVARLLDRFFVAVKVDREERPDVDAYYMNICQLLTGSGGWPLTVFLTPEKRPFFAGTYIPKETRFGKPGLKDILTRVGEAWRAGRHGLLEAAARIAAAAEPDNGGVQEEHISDSILEAGFRQLAGQYDDLYGGFGGAPKFPAPHQLSFLLRYARRARSAQAQLMAEKTLRAMRLGGIFDHLGFGFHRYSTDARWLVPHFEKMLYDQALLGIAYTEAFWATKNPEYRRTVEEIMTYVLRDMTSDAGGFFSAEDADSEGVEGKSYLWQEPEIRRILSPEQAEFALQVFDVRPQGNFSEPQGRPSGKNVLYLRRPPEDLAAELVIGPEDFSARLSALRASLLAAREKRPRPLKDTKILTDWNGLMIAALATAARVLGRDEYGQAAKKAAKFIRRKMVVKGRLHHRMSDGEVKIPGFLDDFAFLIWGLLELYEWEFDASFLEWALRLTDDLRDDFWDETAGGFFSTSEIFRELPARRREVADGAVPSGNSVMLGNLLRLSRLTGRTTLEEMAWKLVSAFGGRVARYPASHTQFLCALDAAFGPAREVVITGRTNAPDMRAMLNVLRSEFAPETVVLFRPAEQASPPILKLAPYAAPMSPLEGKATAYVCFSFRCDLPTADPARLLELLRKI
jgi:uncharacterized protein YyaL (SSP411 family)